MKKFLIIPITALVLGAGVFTVNQALANGPTEQRNRLVTLLAEKLGKNEAEVQAVFDQVKTEQRQQMRAGFEDMLNEAVSDSKITEAQKQLILAKHEEMTQNMQLENHRAEMESWLKENDIPDDLFPLMGGNGPHGPRGQFEK